MNVIVRSYQFIEVFGSGLMLSLRQKRYSLQLIEALVAFALLSVAQSNNSHL